MASGNPHAPRVGRIRRLLGPLHFTGVFWYWLPMFASRYLPRWSFPWLTRLFAFVFLLFLVNVRRALVANLRVVLGPCGLLAAQLRALRTLTDFAACLGDRYESLAFPDRFRVTIEGDELWRGVHSRGKGVLFVTAHIGAWEISSLLAADDTRLRVHVVREQELDPRSQRLMERIVSRRASASSVTHFLGDDPSPSLGLALRQALGRGEIVAIQGDRPRAGGRTVRAELFGRPYLLPAGPLMLARVSGAGLVPVFTFRERHYLYRVVFRQPITIAAEGDREAALAEAARQLGAELEWAIRERPHQWFALGEVWRSSAPLRPQGVQGRPTPSSS